MRYSLSLLALAFLFWLLPAFTEPFAQANKPVTFEEVSSVQSGITWTHDNAHSAERYLPETTGAGCVNFTME